MRVYRSLFRKDNEYVVVRRIRLSGTTYLEPGDIVSRHTHRLYQIQAWFRRRQIGEKGSEWVRVMLENINSAFIKPELGEDVAKNVNALAANAEPEDTMVDVDPDAMLVPFKEGRFWFIPGVEEQFTTKKAAKAYIAETI